MEFAPILESRSRKARRRRRGESEPARTSHSNRWGPWSDLVLDLCDGDFDRAGRVVRWPLREALTLYLRRVQAAELEGYRVARLEWAMLAPHSKRGIDPPDLPEILKET